MITLQDYTFTAPPGWNVQRHPDHVRLQNMESGCLILLLEPQQSSGDAERDARAAFDLMYSGWIYQKSGEQRDLLSKGRTAQGLDYCMIEASMSTTTADARYHLEDGAALVIEAGGRIVIVAARHNSSMLAHERCTRYEGWPRFVAGFVVTNAAPAATDDDLSRKIIGRWTMSESGASGEYIFAANGRYQLTGAIGNSYTTSEHDYAVIHTTTSAFRGDGTYSVSGNRLTLQHRGASRPEDLSIRFDIVSHGGLGWKERLHLLRSDGKGDYEVAYERQDGRATQ